MATVDVANGLVELCRQGKFDEASETYYHPEILSVEADGDSRESRGMDAIRGKMEWWNSTYDVNGAEVEGPYVHEDMFSVRYKIDVTNKQTGEQMVMDEFGLYKVDGDKVIEERFFNAV